MYIFADSGATKTNWIITDTSGNKVSSFQTLGLNPFFWKAKNIYDEINSKFPDICEPLSVEKVFFYGSGCGNHEKYQPLNDALENLFPIAIVYIYSDMLGAARSIFKNNTGIAAILGTGANACVYNGNTIYRNSLSLGFILGDEGSGAYIGKQLVKRYFEEDLDEEVLLAIKRETNIDLPSVLENVYSKPQPNKYLASYCNFIKTYISHPQLSEIVKSSFKEFFEKHILSLKNSFDMPVGFCGSIAFHFQEILLEVAKQYNISIYSIKDDPLSGIIEYHKEKDFF
jgi:glucosamine kinase